MKLPKWKTISTFFDTMAARLSYLATIFLFVSAIILAISFVTPNWLESETHTNQRFRRLGLWEICFVRFHDPYHRYDRVVSGCKFIFDQDYNFIKDFLKPTFFVVTQVLFTAGFAMLVLVCAGILTVKQYFVIEREDFALRALSIASVIPAICCTSALILFSVRGDDRDWMPDPEHNYLSWSVAIAYIGIILLWISSLFFYLDMKKIVKQEERGHQSRHQNSRA